MIIEIHLLQSFPVSNLNRDDIGQPKTVQFGGYTRARVSSQSWKRAARSEFGKWGLRDEHHGTRTKRLVIAAADQIAGVPTDENREEHEQAQRVAGHALSDMGIGVDKRNLTQYLLYLGSDAPKILAEYCTENWDALLAAANGDKKAGKKKLENKGTVKQLLDAERVADIALFGRMVADNTDFNVAAACQVAHAISTHKVATEYDYYTAVDDLRSRDEPGADMIGTIDYNTACYYRYANTDVKQLTTNLGGDGDLAKEATGAWLRSFIESVPVGKQSTMAAATKPEVMLGVVRESGAWSLANAFVTPVLDDYVDASAARMMDHFSRMRGYYGSEQLQRVSYGALNPEAFTLDEAVACDSVADFVAGLVNAAGF